VLAGEAGQKAEPSTPPASTEAYDLGEVVVTPTHRETLLVDAPDVVQVVTRKEIEELNPPSTGELLEYVTGVTVETGTGSGLPKRSVVGLNGLRADYTLVLVNGVRLLGEHIHTGRNIELIPPQSIERIEIIRGAAAAQYGADAIGGVVNIITRKCTGETETGLGASAGNYETYQGDVTWLRQVSERIGVSMFLSRDQSHGIKVKRPEHRIGNMGYERNNVLARVDFAMTESVQVYGWVNGVDNTMDWRGDDTDSYQVMGAVGTSLQLTPSLSLSAQAAYTKWDADVNDEKHELYQPESRLTWEINEQHALTLGADFKRREFKRNAVMDAPDQDTYGAFVQHEWRPWDQLTLMVALRYDDVEDVDGVFSPKASLVYSPDLPLRVRASVARGFHAPTPQELHEEGYGHSGSAYRFGNPDLDPEESTTVAAGLELFTTSPFQIMLYGHYSDIDDMIVPVFQGPWAKDPSVNVWRRTNIEEARVYGGEIRARYTLSPSFRIEGGYSHTDSEDADTGRHLPYDPGSSAFAKAVAEGDLHRDWSWSAFAGLRAVFNRKAWSWKPARGAAANDPSGLTTKLHDYEMLNAGIAFIYKNDYRLFLHVNNILDQNIEHIDDAYTVINGRPTLMVGFRARW